MGRSDKVWIGGVDKGRIEAEERYKRYIENDLRSGTKQKVNKKDFRFAASSLINRA